MADKLIRVGRVSKIDYEHGMISVTYPDLDDSVTVPLATASFNDEYKMPQVGDEVLAVHLPSGQARGVVLGRYWNLRNVPAVGGADMYRKEYGHENGEAFCQYITDGELIFVAPSIRLQDASGSITVAELLDLKRRVASLEARI